MRWRRPVCWGLVAAAVGVACAVALADTLRTKEGKMYTGVVEIVGTTVRITLEDGSKLTFDAKDVEEVLRGRTPLQEYANREAKIKPDDADGRFNLALWCERMNLKTAAVRECAKGLAIRPDHPRARELMLHLLESTRSATTRPPDRPETQPAAVVGRNLLLEERPASQQYFRGSIQPILSRRCASAECHGGPSAGRLRLKRTRIGGPATGDVYLPNFDAIYPFITDFYKPEKALLLQHPLAVKEGGIPSKCKKVFRSQSDPGFQAIGRLIRGLLLPPPPTSEGGSKAGGRTTPGATD